MKKILIPVTPCLAALLLLAGCARTYHTFADYPGMGEHYRDRCRVPPPSMTDEELELLARHLPRFVLPPGGDLPIDFYRDYVPNSVLRTWPGKKVAGSPVTAGLLLKHRVSRSRYLDLDRQKLGEAGLPRLVREGVTDPGPGPVVYGRVYREQVTFPAEGGGTETHGLTFLKYNLLFATSGLPAKLGFWPDLLVGLAGFDRRDWHELDNFVAVHIVLDDSTEPVAVLLAQHNHHRAYVARKDIFPGPDGRYTFDVALRSNEIYPASDSPEPVQHRVIRWSLYLDYLLSGKNPPSLLGFDVTHGTRAGGIAIEPELVTLSPCDPLYTSEMLLGEPRPFFGIYIGRDGPPGSDYYSIPPLLPLGNLLKFAHLHDGDERDISLVREAIDRSGKQIDIDAVMEHGGRTFLAEWKELRGKL